MITNKFKSLMILLLLFGCAKDEQFTPKQPNGEETKTLADLNAKKAGQVITIYPSGGDDTNNLYQAFEDAKASGPGVTVQLVEGEYHIGLYNGHFMEIKDFEGYFKGAGKDKTIIKSAFENVPCDEIMLTDNVLPALFNFIRGEIYISNMSFIVEDGSPCAPPSDPNYLVIGYDLYSIIVIGDYSGTDIEIPNDHRVTGYFENIDFFGGSDENLGGAFWQTEQNVLVTIWCGGSFWFIDPLPPRTNGKFEVRNCHFDNLLDCVEGAGLVNSTMIVENNLSTNCPWPLYFIENLDSRINIKNNKFFDATIADILIDNSYFYVWKNELPTTRMIYEIEGNEFHTAENGPTLVLQENRIAQYPEEDLPMFFKIKNNTFNNASNGIAIMCLSLQDAQIKNNKFTGTGMTGILIDHSVFFDFGYGEMVSDMANNILMQGNNFNGASYDLANIWLTENSMNCTVVGGNNKNENVIDDGTDNLISGMTVNQGSVKFGPTITDNLGIGRDLMKSRKIH